LDHFYSSLLSQVIIMQNILLVGQDSRLLLTRAAVLRKTEANVICCSASQAMEFVESEPLDLVVLCHSLMEADAEMIAEKIHRRSQKPRVLLVVSDPGRKMPYQDSKFDATSLPDPTELIAQATELLQGVPGEPLKEIVSYRS
jgi:CheY-like chemotaxis protein